MRQRDETGHEVAMLSTDYLRDLGGVAVALFARCCQENFFQYMGRHYGSDPLIEYGTEPLPETTTVVNPAWRRKDQEVRRQRAVLVRLQAQFGALSLPPQPEPEAVAAYEQEKGRRLEQLQQQEQKLGQLKAQRKALPRHLTLKELPQAETALVALAREKLARSEDARSLIRQIFESAVDLSPDLEGKTLTVRVHRLSSGIHDAVLEHVCAELTATETVYPGTDLRLVFEPVRSSQIPRDQESGAYVHAFQRH